MAEKFSIIPSLKERKKELTGKRKLALVGQGDFPGANNIMRATMNIKHQIQHLTIDDPDYHMYMMEKKMLQEKIHPFMNGQKITHVKSSAL